MAEKKKSDKDNKIDQAFVDSIINYKGPSSKFGSEQEAVNEGLMKYIVMPAKRLGGEKGQAVGSAIAAGLSSLHEMVRKPARNDGVLEGGLASPGARIAKPLFKALRMPATAGKIAKKASTSAQQMKEAAEMTAGGGLTHTDKARIIRKFQEANPWYKTKNNLHGSNIEEEFKALGRTIKALKQEGKEAVKVAE